MPELAGVSPFVRYNLSGHMLSPGTRVGPYEIVAAIGAGGMGEVYRARDTKLRRDIALKMLPADFAADAERLARFHREAEVLATLNHPNVAAIHGLEDSTGIRALVLELVDGDTLSDRIASGPMPVDDALRIAKQIAEALEAAHERAIVHRDLKPANIKVTPGGMVKVLDFGIAKFAETSAAATSAAETSMPTASASPRVMTQAGVLIGTSAYMSPEQARGLAVDKRTDIWAFGCVLFELLTARPAFAGDTRSDTLARVLEREPDWRLLPPATPPRVRWLLRRCLAKDVKSRVHDIADARIELDETLHQPREGSDSTAGVTGSRMRERIVWSCVVILLAALAAFAFERSGSGDGRPPEPRRYVVSLVLPENLRMAATALPGSRFTRSGYRVLEPAGRFALSPDGRFLALVAFDSSGRSMLYVRPLDSRAVRPLPGTEGGAFPFWSPDSGFIGFLADNKLKKVAVNGGEVSTLANDVELPATGAWGRDNVILYTPRGNSPLFRVSAAGSATPVAVTTLNTPAGDVQHSFPVFLPDGQHFLYFVVGTAGAQTLPRGVYATSLDDPTTSKLILEGASNAKYANGHLLYLRDGALLAQPFDTDRLELRGEAIPLSEQVQTIAASASTVVGAFSVSETGVLAYQTGSTVRSQLTWFDHDGATLGTIGDPADYVDVALSPDGSRVATSLLDPGSGTRDIWTFDVLRGIGEQTTFEPSDDFAPNWSRPNGDRIVFTSARSGAIHLYEKTLGASASPSLLLEDALGKFNAHFSPDGRFLVYVAGGGVIARSDLWVLPLTGDRQARPFMDAPFLETQPQFSPDGKWLAFVTIRSGRPDVYVTDFPGRRHETLVSRAGGMYPRWNGSGQLLYIAPDERLTSVDVVARGEQIEAGTPRPLFRMEPRTSRLDAYPYDVAAGGRRILVNRFREEVMPAITLVVNWVSGS